VTLENILTAEQVFLDHQVNLVALELWVSRDSQDILEKRASKEYLDSLEFQVYPDQLDQRVEWG